MTIISTRNVSNRIRGFLSSSLLELAPGTYSGSRVSSAVRERIWRVLQQWFAAESNASIVLVWQDSQVPGGQSVRVLGAPPVSLVELDGIVLARRSPVS